ncbi:hypothetical protein AC1031_012380 [Aphanomyces cochlioides]|nr:hypothetical protein AC1031_012380 [Aphanomyces cochlioides]
MASKHQHLHHLYRFKIPQLDTSFKNGGRVGAFVGATAGAIGGTVGGAAAGTAIAGPAGGVVGAAFGVTSGIYAGTPLGRQAGAKIGGAGGRVIDKISAHRDAKAKANAPPPPIGKKKRSRSQAITPSRAQPTEKKTTPSKATTGQAEKRPGIFSRAKESIKTTLRNAVTPRAKKCSARMPKHRDHPPQGAQAEVRPDFGVARDKTVLAPNKRRELVRDQTAL